MEHDYKSVELIKDIIYQEFSRLISVFSSPNFYSFLLSNLSNNQKKLYYEESQFIINYLRAELAIESIQSKALLCLKEFLEYESVSIVKQVINGDQARIASAVREAFSFEMSESIYPDVDFEDSLWSLSEEKSSLVSHIIQLAFLYQKDTKQRRLIDHKLSIIEGLGSV